MRSATKRFSVGALVLVLSLVLLGGGNAESQALASVSLTGQVTATTVTPGTGQSQANQGIGKHLLVWIANGTVSSCTVQLESSSSVGGAYALLPGFVAQTCTSSGSIALLAQPVNALRINPTAMTGSGSVQFFYTGYLGTPPQGYGQVGVIYSTPSAASTASISATTMATPTFTGQYRLSWHFSQSVVAASCASNPTLTANVIFQDANAASGQTVVLALHTITGPTGTLGNVPWTSGPISYTFTAKAATNIQYSTTLGNVGSCSPNPTYTFTPILEALN